MAELVDAATATPAVRAAMAGENAVLSRRPGPP